MSKKLSPFVGNFGDRISLSRRAFLQHGSLVLSTAGLYASGVGSIFAQDPQPPGGASPPALAATGGQPVPKPDLRIAVLTDPHYADLPPQGTRYYRESLAKVREAIGVFVDRQADILVEVGDLIDTADTLEGEINNLKTIEPELDKFPRDRHYVLGNHCVYGLTKEEFRANSKAKEAPYSLDASGFHIVILDACYTADGQHYGRKNFTWSDSNIHPPQQDWLKSDLAASNLPTIVFVHQRLDVPGNYGVRQQADVRKILADSGKVAAVFMGHNHVNDHREIDNIHYVTLQAVVEGSGEANNAYSLLDLSRDGTIRIDGFRKHADIDWKRAAAPA